MFITYLYSPVALSGGATQVSLLLKALKVRKTEYSQSTYPAQQNSRDDLLYNKLEQEHQQQRSQVWERGDFSPRKDDQGRAI